MKFINDSEIEFTDSEMIIYEIHATLMDLGIDAIKAVDMILGSDVPPYLKSPTPMIDSFITAEFIAYLRS